MKVHRDILILNTFCHTLYQAWQQIHTQNRRKMYCKFSKYFLSNVPIRNEMQICIKKTILKLQNQNTSFTLQVISLNCMLTTESPQALTKIGEQNTQSWLLDYFSR